MISILLLAALPFAQQEPAPPQVEARWSELRSAEEEDVVVYRFRDFEARIPGDEAAGLAASELHAADLELRFDRMGYRALAGDAEAAAEWRLRPALPRPEPRGPLAALWSERLLGVLGLPDEAGTALQSVRMAGDVVLVTREVVLRCDQFDSILAEGTTRITAADLMLPPGYGPNGWPLRLLADELVEAPDGRLEARQAILSTCDAEAPHFALEVERLRGVPDGPTGYRWAPEGGWLQIGGHRLAPLPTPDFGAGEGDSLLSLHGVRLGSNARDGQSLELDLRGGTDVDEEGRLDWRLLPGVRTRRGVPLGAELGLSLPGYRGDWELFFLQDGGEDRHRFSDRVARADDTRTRARLWNRFELDPAWRLDVDVALTSDVLVDPEFFEERWREQEDTLSEIYLRRDAGGPTFFDARVEASLDDAAFAPLEGFGPAGGTPPGYTESLPVLRWQAYPTTLTTLPAGVLGGADGRLPLQFATGAELGRLRWRERDLLAPPGAPPFASRPDATRDRVRAWAEVAAPIHLSGFYVRPAARLQGLAYDADRSGSGDADRRFAEASVEIGTLFLKDWSHGWQHRVLPVARYRHLDVAGTPPGRLVGFDEWDALESGEAVELALRQEWIAPGGETWADIELRLPWYPDPDQPLLDPVFPRRRAGEAAESWGPAELRATWIPGVHGDTLTGVRAEARVRQDLHTGRWVEQFARLQVQPHERLEYGLGFRKVDGLLSQAEATIDWRVSDDWGLRFVQPYNFVPGASKRSELAVRRYGHDFVFEIGVERDQASGQSGVFFQLVPRFLVDRGPGAAGSRM